MSRSARSSPHRSRLPAAAALAFVLATTASAEAPHGLIAATPTPGFPNIGYATWAPQEPAYRLFPGDVLEVTFPSAPELNREATIQPDGRISLPLIAPTMAADLTTPDLQGILSAAYASLLVDPRVDVAVKAAQPLRVFVGGEVQKPGVYDMPGDIDALQAVIMAGGFTSVAKRHDVIVLRRGPGGQPLMRLIDLREAIFRPGLGGPVPLRRFDVIYVPRTNIGNADAFVDHYIRQLIPSQFSYQLSPTSYATVP